VSRSILIADDHSLFRAALRVVPDED